MNLGPIDVKKLTGKENFTSNAINLNLSISDFWSWSASDVLNNSMRGILAEFLVASALHLLDKPRVEWGPYDLVMEDGTKIEVKSASYLQSWFQQRYSNISFDIRPTLAWDSITNTYTQVPTRQSDLYVFCLLNHKDKLTVDPLNMDQWEFYVVRTNEINKKWFNQKTISLSTLLKLEHKLVSYVNLAEEIYSLMNNHKE